jgi:hypothetical protein
MPIEWDSIVPPMQLESESKLQELTRAKAKPIALKGRLDAPTGGPIWRIIDSQNVRKGSLEAPPTAHVRRPHRRKSPGTARFGPQQLPEVAVVVGRTDRRASYCLRADLPERAVQHTAPEAVGATADEVPQPRATAHPLAGHGVDCGRQPVLGPYSARNFPRLGNGSRLDVGPVSQ